MNEALQALEIKVENGGATPQGKFFAKDWNTLVEAVKQLDLAEFDEAALNKYLKDNGYITSDDIPSTDLSDVVTRSGEQTIPGAKNFTGGLMVNGQPIVWNAEKGVWQLTGDLVVTGAISMFSSLSGFVPSTVTDAVLVDNETIIKVKDAQGNWVLRALGGGSGGTGGGLTAAEVNALISNALKPYALSSSIPTDNKQLENGAGYITASALSGLATEQYVTTRGYITSDALAGYATEQWVGDNYLPSANFTKANIKSTLGISDWALSATKPSYTAAEVGALSTSGGSVSSDDYQPLIVNSNFSSGIEDVRIGISHNWNIKGLFNWESNGVGLRMYNTACGSAIGIKDDGTPYYDSYELIHLGNIGSYNAGGAKKLISPNDMDMVHLSNNTLYIGDSVFPDTSTHILGNDIRLRYGASATVGLMLTANGNIVIGDTTADAKLHVYGDILSKGSMRCVGVYGGFAMYAGIRDGEALAIERLANHGGWVGMGITMLNNGNVGFGYTTPEAKVHVGGDVKIGGMLNITSNNTPAIVLTDSSRQESSIAFKGTGGNEWYVGKGVGGINDFFGIYNAYKGNALVIDNNSDVTIYGNLLTTGAITMFSQLSMKNVIDYDGLSLTQLAQIRPARFTWKDERDNRIHVGGIADYIQPILPEVVYETVNKELTVDYGSAAFYIGTSLIKPVIDHEKRIAELEREVEYLREENRQLRAS